MSTAVWQPWWFERPGTKPDTQNIKEISYFSLLPCRKFDERIYMTINNTDTELKLA